MLHAQPQIEISGFGNRNSDFGTSIRHYVKSSIVKSFSQFHIFLSFTVCSEVILIFLFSFFFFLPVIGYFGVLPCETWRRNRRSSIMYDQWAVAVTGLWRTAHAYRRRVFVLPGLLPVPATEFKAAFARSKIRWTNVH
jgi:hypothetical protein